MFIDGSIIQNSLLLGMAILIIASFVAGYIDSISGGAGLILIPAFILTGLPPQLALGQEKLVSTIGTIAAIKNFFKNNSIVWKIVPAGIVSGLIGAYIGAKTILFLPTEVISYIIVILLPFGLIAAFLKGKIQGSSTHEIRYSIVTTFITCFIVGFYDGFFGPGTGSLFIIVLSLFNRLTLLQASATSKIFNFSSNIGAFIAFLIAGQMAFLIGIPMVLASLLGNHIGSIHAIKTNGEIVRKVLIITVLFMMITLLYQVLK